MSLGIPLNTLKYHIPTVSLFSGSEDHFPPMSSQVGFQHVLLYLCEDSCSFFAPTSRQTCAHAYNNCQYGVVVLINSH